MLVLAHIGLGAAHATFAIDVFVYGLVFLAAGFTMRWTAWGFGLGQVLKPELYDEIGLWLIRLGTVMSLAGSFLVITFEYIH